MHQLTELTKVSYKSKTKFPPTVKGDKKVLPEKWN